MNNMRRLVSSTFEHRNQIQEFRRSNLSMFILHWIELEKMKLRDEGKPVHPKFDSVRMIEAWRENMADHLPISLPFPEAKQFVIRAFRAESEQYEVELQLKAFRVRAEEEKQLALEEDMLVGIMRYTQGLLEEYVAVSEAQLAGLSELVMDNLNLGEDENGGV